jgi:hypothetical protein
MEEDRACGGVGETRPLAVIKTVTFITEASLGSKGIASMKTSVASAAWAAVLTVISGAVILAGVPRPIALLALPAFPGFLLTFIFGIGPNIEGIPGPTNIFLFLLTFAVWWAIFYIGVARWRRRRYR